MLASCARTQTHGVTARPGRRHAGPSWHAAAESGPGEGRAAEESPWPVTVVMTAAAATAPRRPGPGPAPGRRRGLSGAAAGHGPFPRGFLNAPDGRQGG